MGFYHPLIPPRGEGNVQKNVFGLLFFVFSIEYHWVYSLKGSNTGRL